MNPSIHPVPRVRRRALVAAPLALVATLFAGLGPSAHAQTPAAGYPNKPIRIVVPYTPGGASDVTMRAIAQEMTKDLGQTVFVENKAGGGGIVGTQEVARSPADGYTLVAGNNGTHVVNPLIRADLPYDVNKDFTPIALVAQTPLFIALNPALKIDTLAQFIALAKSKPGKVTFASPGNAHTLAIEYLGLLAGVKFDVIRYKGPAQALTDTMAGHVDAFVDTGIAVLPQAKAGKLKVIAVTSLQRVPAFPDLPAVAETYAGYDAVGTNALFAAGQVPAPIAAKLTAAVQKAMQSPAVTKTILEGAGVPAEGDSAGTRKWLEANTALWKSVIQKTGVVLE